MKHTEQFLTLAQLRQKLTEVLETITPEVIIFITSYDFIRQALFSASMALYGQAIIKNWYYKLGF
ncbi:hypothetical protein [Brasilonema bromeliae]|uniref:Uncharacterized protein n=1 Tax=Brasilonema bromeliae SPC951 TaxID=385972 RepID=A0ABX1PCX2_9CYAN|nr:hypothetical protein [Brasilonema bromeliae]NMG21406.1 hypothetical protein [Brasilonema bromeliae SPC951]